MKTLKLYAVVVAATVLACASVKPAPVQAGDRCLRCGRVVSDVRLAAEMIDSLRAPFPFRTAGCMAKYVKEHADRPVTALFVTDQTTGRMILIGDAWFVPTVLPVPERKIGENDFAAFGSRAAAEAFRAGRAPLLRWPQVVGEAAAN